MSRTLPRPMRGRVLILDSYKSIYAACFSSSARHFPCAARPFMCARWKNAFCAAPTLPGCPRQVFSAAFCSAREYEKVSGHGSPFIAAMAFRCAVAASSDWPPERNTMPGCAAGTVRFSTRTVRSDLVDAGLPRAVLARHHHAGLEDEMLDRH